MSTLSHPSISHRVVETNGIRMRIAEQGEGPAVVLCHGFPESWYSWRHQLPALAAAGYHAVAPDMRGYGGTDRPGAVELPFVQGSAPAERSPCVTAVGTAVDAVDNAVKKGKSWLDRLFGR